MRQHSRLTLRRRYRDPPQLLREFRQAHVQKMNTQGGGEAVGSGPQASSVQTSAPGPKGLRKKAAAAKRASVDADNASEVRPPLARVYRLKTDDVQMTCSLCLLASCALKAHMQDWLGSIESSVLHIQSAAWLRHSMMWEQSARCVPLFPFCQSVAAVSP